MTHKRFNLKFKQYNVACQSWVPKKSKKTIVMVHGYGAYSDNFKELAKLLVNENISCYSFDLMGFGRSSGIRGYIKNFKEYFDFIKSFTKKLGDYYLLGQSMGSLICLRYAMEKKDENLKAIICGSPPLKYRNVSKKKQALVIMLGYIFPKYSKKLSMSHHKKNKYNEKKLNDPLRVKTMTMRFGQQLFLSKEIIRKNPEKLKKPVLFLQGLDDATVLPDFIEEYDLKIKNSNLIKYPKGPHNLFESNEKKKVANDIIAWIS